MTPVMPGFIAGHHVFLWRRPESGVDGRSQATEATRPRAAKPRHDEFGHSRRYDNPGAHGLLSGAFGPK